MWRSKTASWFSPPRTRASRRARPTARIVVTGCSAPALGEAIQTMAKSTEPVTIKKYANRRLYNTATSAYVTLEDLARMGSFDWKREDGSPVLSIEGLRVFGLGPGANVEFRQLLRMLPPEDRAGFLTVLHDVMSHSSVLATDIPVTLADGRQRIIHTEAEPEFNEHGNLVGYTGIVQDVTDRLPEIIEWARALPPRELVLEGEAIALRPEISPFTRARCFVLVIFLSRSRSM